MGKTAIRNRTVRSDAVAVSPPRRALVGANEIGARGGDDVGEVGADGVARTAVIVSAKARFAA